MSKIIFLSSVLMSSIFLHGVLCMGNHGQENGPRPPPPPPPAPHGSMTVPESTPQHVPPPPLEPDVLLPNQCYFGPENVDEVDESSEGYTDADALYLLANDPAECSGIIDSFDLCYYITQVVSSYSIQFITFRKEYTSNIVSAYRKINADSMDIEKDFVTSESGEAFCDIFELNNALSLSEGDVLGFITTQGFNVALLETDERSVFQYVPSSDEQRKKSLMVNDLQSIPTTQLKQANNTATPALKIIMNATNSSSQILPTPTVVPTENPSNDPCNNRDNSRSISFFTFAAAMVASAITIFALVVVVLILFCCLCGCCVCCAGCCDCKICKVFKVCCNKKCLSCCQRKGPSAQKVSGIVDQSMQYNDLYLPPDLSKVISGGLQQSTELHENPSYGQQTTSSSSQRRGFEHTYESIEVSRQRHVL